MIELLIFTVIFLFLLDQLSKYLIKLNLHVFERIPVIPGFLYFTHVRNTGGVFGIFPQQTILFSIGTILVLILLFLSFFYYKYTPIQALSIAMVMGGALGNLFDRVYFGYVTDFLDIRVWPIFNLADTFVVVGIITFILNELLLHRR